ncbi:MAG: hypothetical protein KA419_12655 [Acidobacteria bacterium]|nr:hypothetical protein [Acidobacteriota bacterium]
MGMKITWFGLILSGALILPGGVAFSAGAERPEAKGQQGDFTLVLPTTLEDWRTEYRETVAGALDQVIRWFAANGFKEAPGDLLDTVIVHDDPVVMRRELSRRFGVPESSVPDTFAGTVQGKTLFLVSAPRYEKIYRDLYPEWPWNPAEYRRLAAHELAHAAHARIVRERTGSEDAMGPRWFFEGLAICCAGQFEPAAGQDKPLDWAQFMAYVGRDREKVLSYPVYGAMFRALDGKFAVKDLVRQAADPGFPATLEKVGKRPRP